MLKKIVTKISRILWRNISQIVYQFFIRIPYFHFIRNTVGNQNPCTFSTWFMQKVLGFNRKVYWPVHFSSRINLPENISVGIDTCPGIAPGCYIQGVGSVRIGNYTQVAQNVGIVSMNHDIYNLPKHDATTVDVSIGDYCWIGMNSVILPGVVLGDFTIIGAGAVVTKSFPEGHCVIAGNPAKILRKLDKEKCVRHEVNGKYFGYIKAEKFDSFRKNKLWF